MPINKALYHFVSWGFQNWIWRGDLTSAQNLPEHGPAILVSNHLGALGPIAVGGSFPREFYSWIHADILDPRLAPDYLRRDFVEPELHVPPPASRWIAGAITHIHIPLLRAVGGVSVYHSPDGIQATFRDTIDLLAEGNIILIFPEDPSLPLDPRYNMRPFQKGFTRCGELFFERTRQSLPFYPLAVHAQSRTVRVGKPIWYDPNNGPGHERQRIKSTLEQSIHAMLTDSAAFPPG